jgi:hypothetical protein
VAKAAIFLVRHEGFLGRVVCTCTWYKYVLTLDSAQRRNCPSVQYYTINRTNHCHSSMSRLQLVAIRSLPASSVGTGAQSSLMLSDCCTENRTSLSIVVLVVVCFSSFRLRTAAPCCCLFPLFHGIGQKRIVVLLSLLDGCNQTSYRIAVTCCCCFFRRDERTRVVHAGIAVIPCLGLIPRHQLTNQSPNDNKQNNENV